jgi:hypothetical protein
MSLGNLDPFVPGTIFWAHIAWATRFSVLKPICCKEWCFDPIFPKQPPFLRNLGTFALGKLQVHFSKGRAKTWLSSFLPKEVAQGFLFYFSFIVYDKNLRGWRKESNPSTFELEWVTLTSTPQFFLYNNCARKIIELFTIIQVQYNKFLNSFHAGHYHASSLVPYSIDCSYLLLASKNRNIPITKDHIIKYPLLSEYSTSWQWPLIWHWHFYDTLMEMCLSCGTGLIFICGLCMPKLCMAPLCIKQGLKASRSYHT